MDQFLQQVVSGIASGSLLAIVALAIVLIYRSTDVANFAQGEMALFTAFIAWSFMHLLTGGQPGTAGWQDFWLAFVLSLAAAGLLGGALQLLILRHLEGKPPLNALIVTLGLFTFFNGLTLWIWGADPKGFGPFSVFSGSAVSIGSASIGRDNFGTLIVALIVMALLFILFQRTSLGLAMRAAAQNRTASRLVGIRVGRMLAIGWALAAVVGAVAGVMVAQDIGLFTSSMFTILIFAFAGAVLGGLDSPVGAIVGCLVVAVTKNLAGTYISSQIDTTVALMVIVGVLMVRPTGLFGRRTVRRV